MLPGAGAGAGAGIGVGELNSVPNDPGAFINNQITPCITGLIIASSVLITLFCCKLLYQRVRDTLVCNHKAHE